MNLGDTRIVNVARTGVVVHEVEADLKQLVKLDSTSSFVGGIRVQAGQSAPTTVFFARCPPVTTEEQVRQVFSDFGQIDEINLYRRWQSAKTSKGCGFVRYKEHAAAAAALEALNGKFMFETSEAPMVVEWIDPARLVTRQPTSGGKQSAPRSRKSGKEQPGDSTSPPRCQQTLQKPTVIHAVSGALLDQSRIVNSQLRPCSSGMGHGTAASGALMLSDLQGQEVHGCLPARMVHMQHQSKVPAPILAGSGLHALHHVAPAVSTAVIAGPASALVDPTSLLQPNTYQPWVSKPLDVLPAQLGIVSDETNLPLYIPMNSSCVASVSQPLIGVGSVQAVGSNSTLLTAMGSCMQNSSSAHVMCLEDIAAVSGCLPLQSGEQMSGLGAASGPWITSCASAGVLSGSAAYAPMHSGLTASDCVSSFSHPLFKSVKPGLDGVDYNSLDGADVRVLQQLQAMGMVHPAAAGGIGSDVNIARQPAVGGLLENTVTGVTQGSTQAPELTVNPGNAQNITDCTTNKTPTEGSQTKATIAVEPDVTADIISNMELLNKVSGAHVALVADGQGVQLHVRGTLTAVSAAYQMLCLLCPGKQPVLGDLLVAQD